MSVVLSNAKRITGGVIAAGAVVTAGITAHLAGGSTQPAASVPATDTSDTESQSSDTTVQQPTIGTDPATGWDQSNAAAAGTHGS